MKPFNLALRQFWIHHPALFYGFSALIGVSLPLFHISWMLSALAFTLILLPLIAANNSHLRILLALGLASACFFVAHKSYQFPDITQPISGTADIEINAFASKKTPFGKVWSYQATLLDFRTKDAISIAKNIPVRFSLPFKNQEKRPEASHRYRMQTRLKKNEYGSYSLSGIKNNAWLPIAPNTNLVDWRYKAKTSLQNYIKENVQDEHVGAFLSGIATGQFDDMQLAYELGRFGLQHLMAISGLHFSIIAAFLGFALSLFFSRSAAAFLLILMLSSYFLFLGNSPSVLRAWMAITATLVGVLIGKKGNALNSLGLGILLLVLWNPLLVESIAFQFSFGVTAAILMLFAPCDSLLQRVFAKRNLSEMATASWWEQHGYCFLCFLRQGLALTLAVNIVAVPLTLYHFHQFPALALFYNLFFPLMISFSMLLLILACLVSPVTMLSQWLFNLNERYTQFVLNFAFNLPKTFDANWHWSDLSQEWLVGYLMLVFVVGIWAWSHDKNRNEVISV